MTFWRSAGITYVRYSQIAATITRKCAKSAQQGRAPATLRITKWENGKPVVTAT
ncbi:unnamed protein product [Toxocara canis]|uniref:ATP synthase subunit epsilon, mitochondrial n=1 Tax=Toxocara canis TaxID=6265 RepID=A0A183UEK9_TOXCA|nr:unnamed protein product [Toxocara canis]